MDGGLGAVAFSVKGGVGQGATGRFSNPGAARRERSTNRDCPPVSPSVAHCRKHTPGASWPNHTTAKMSHKLPRTLQAVPNTLHARLEIADAMRKLSAADQEGWVQQRREELAALRRDIGKLREDLRRISRTFPTLLLTELRKAGFNPDEPRVPAGDFKGGQWTKEGGSGSWIDSVADWFRHTSDPEWAEAQNVQDLVENHPRAAIISGSAGLGIALGPAIIALAADALVFEGFSVTARVV
jgi:hypothetical protein